MKKFYFFLLIPHLWIQAANTAEIDSVTPRKIELDDSAEAINSIITQRIQEGITNANTYREYIEEIDDYLEIDYECDEDVLYSELRKSIFQSYTVSWGLRGYALDLQLRSLLSGQSYSLSLNDSIYRDIDYLEGFSLKLKELSDVVNIDGHLVGLDKIGHFFAEGWQYFELTRYQGESVEAALEWGRLQEMGKYGYVTTGIFSYADLTANLNGWRFWNRILLEEDDPVKSWWANLFERPYISCEIQVIESIKKMQLVKAWEQGARFDISAYIDGAWDEANNCNSYADPVIENKVVSRIKQIDAGFLCPLNAEYCMSAREKYGRYAKYILHPYCMIAGDED
ncbi:MAG: hypothetical protein KJN89_08300 [Gammaproteobacteria bacterium]|nr:hypothetical protein [Gammaproteobacteria bacterium]NNJ50363.1 hypothetical protein [Gammaproteobacteria bacterium]